MAKYYGFSLVFMFMIHHLPCMDCGSIAGRLPELQRNTRAQFYPSESFSNSSRYIPSSNDEYAYREERHTHTHTHTHVHDPNHMVYPSDFVSQTRISSTTRRETGPSESDDYPYNEIRTLLDQNSLLKQYFMQVPDLGNRGNVPDDDGAEMLCEIKTYTDYYPKKLKNLNDVEVLVVNDDKDYKQAVEYKTCGTEGQCKVPFTSFGYTSYCQQKYEKKQLMVYENSTKKLVFDQFRIPTCCVCMIKRV